MIVTRDRCLQIVSDFGPEFPTANAECRLQRSPASPVSSSGSNKQKHESKDTTSTQVSCVALAGKLPMLLTTQIRSNIGTELQWSQRYVMLWHQNQQMQSVLAPGTHSRWISKTNQTWPDHGTKAWLTVDVDIININRCLISLVARANRVLTSCFLCGGVDAKPHRKKRRKASTLQGKASRLGIVVVTLLDSRAEKL